jgi:hypothetical protein
MRAPAIGQANVALGRRSRPMVRRNHVQLAVAASVLVAASSLVAGTTTGATVSKGPPTPPAAHVAGPNQGNGAKTSHNWAGYAVTGGLFTKALGSWVQPRATCPTGAAQYAAFWVGIDGFAPKDPTVEQIGTDSDCASGAGNYYAWYQMYPRAAVRLPPAKYPVAPGQVIHAQVSASGKAFTLTIHATSPSWTFATTQTTTTLPKESSAELITESPCVGSPTCVRLLADFGTIDFSGAAADGRAFTATGLTATKLTMVSTSNVVKAKPSGLSSGGTAFSVTWAHN